MVHPEPWFGVLELSVSPARCRAGILSEQDLLFACGTMGSWRSSQEEPSLGATPDSASRAPGEDARGLSLPEPQCVRRVNAPFCAEPKRDVCQERPVGWRVYERFSRLCFGESAGSRGGSGCLSPLARTCPSRGGPRERVLHSHS